jgi:hypothetical protein
MCRCRAIGLSRVARAAAGWQGATPAPGAGGTAGPILAGWTIEVSDTAAARIALARRMLGCPGCDQPRRPLRWVLGRRHGLEHTCWRPRINVLTRGRLLTMAPVG